MNRGLMGATGGLFASVLGRRAGGLIYSGSVYRVASRWLQPTRIPRFRQRFDCLEPLHQDRAYSSTSLRIERRAYRAATVRERTLENRP